jgi:RNA polymerase sigma-70 factor, ECF subfamily
MSAEPGFAEEMQRVVDSEVGRPNSAPALAAILAWASGANELWPTVRLPPRTFVAHVARHLRSGAISASALHLIHGEDLFLACASALGDGAALEVLETELFPVVFGALLRTRRTELAADELAQLLRVRLLVADPGALPRIAEFAGQGPLVGWIRIAATRIVLRASERAVLERATFAPALDDDVLNVNSLGADPEVQQLRARFGQEFSRAFRISLQALAPRDRNLLRYQYVHGLTGHAIAALYHVNRSSVTRWGSLARQSLMAKTRAELQDRLQLSPDLLDSMMRLLLSQLEVSLERVLPAQAETE